MYEKVHLVETKRGGAAFVELVEESIDPRNTFEVKTERRLLILSKAMYAQHTMVRFWKPKRDYHALVETKRGTRSQRPANWSQREGAAFIDHIKANVAEGYVWKAKGGRGGGTWAHWQIALAYAKYLSHDFHAWASFPRWYVKTQNAQIKALDFRAYRAYFCEYQSSTTGTHKEGTCRFRNGRTRRARSQATGFIGTTR